MSDLHARRQFAHSGINATGFNPSLTLFIHSENTQNYIPGLINNYCSARFDLVGMNESEAHAYEVHPDERRKYVRLANTKSDYTIPDIDRWFEKNHFGMLHPVQFESMMGCDQGATTPSYGAGRLAWKKRGD